MVEAEGKDTRWKVQELERSGGVEGYPRAPSLINQDAAAAETTVGEDHKTWTRQFNEVTSL